MSRINDSIFEKLNIEKYIIENLTVDNIEFHKKDKVIEDCEAITYQMEKVERAETRMVISFPNANIFGFSNIKIFIERKSYRDYEPIVSKKYKWYSSLFFVKKIIKLKNEKKSVKFTEKENELISRLPQDFVRECAINTLNLEENE